MNLIFFSFILLIKITSKKVNRRPGRVKKKLSHESWYTIHIILFFRGTGGGGGSKACTMYIYTRVKSYWFDNNLLNAEKQYRLFYVYIKIFWIRVSRWCKFHIFKVRSNFNRKQDKNMWGKGERGGGAGGFDTQCDNWKLRTYTRGKNRRKNWK